MGLRQSNPTESPPIWGRRAAPTEGTFRPAGGRGYRPVADPVDPTRWIAPRGLRAAVSPHLDGG